MNKTATWKLTSFQFWELRRLLIHRQEMTQKVPARFNDNASIRLHTIALAKLTLSLRPHNTKPQAEWAGTLLWA